MGNQADPIPGQTIPPSEEENSSLESKRRLTVTPVVEDYVTRIWKALELPGGSPTTTDLATQLAVTPSTVSATLRKLSRDGFIEYEPYGTIRLTDAGRAIALTMVRRHRILETYLNQRLGLSWDQVHEEADRLEHAVSDLVLDRMADALGNPSHDPHGDPIPTRDGALPDDHSISLAEAERGSRLRVERVSDRSPELLLHLDHLGIRIGTELMLLDHVEIAETIEVLVDQAPTHLSLSTAAAIRVLPLN